MNKTVALAVLLSLAAGSAAAQEPITLRLAYPSSNQSITWQQWFEPWTKRVQADSNNAVQVQPFFGSTLANFMNSYDRTVAGVADIAWGVSNSMTGKLRGSTVVELPSEYTSRDASAAMWRLLEQGLISAEWAEVKPLMFFVFPASTVNFTQPITKLEDLRGVKIATITKADSDIYQLLGATPVTAAVSEFYEMVNRRVVSGFAVGWAALQTFKLHEVTTYHLKFEGACGAGFFIMNKATYEKLPEAGKRAIDRNAGYEASKGVGAVTDRSFNATEEFLKKAPGHTVASLPPAEKQRWLVRIQPIIDKWVTDTPNGAATLAAFRAEVAKTKAEP
jgi:TRAP-type C4-dicarboxylate transport system substrate-binding protein